MIERARKASYALAAVALREWRRDHAADPRLEDPEVRAELFKIGLRFQRASEVPLSPTADDPTQPSGPPSSQPARMAVPFMWWCERCDAYQDTPTLDDPCPVCGEQRSAPKEEVQPAEVAAEAGAGGGVREGAPPPASDSSGEHGVSCDGVARWLNGGRALTADGTHELHRRLVDHLLDCESCQGVARLRDLEEAVRQS